LPLVAELAREKPLVCTRSWNQAALVSRIA